MQIYNEFGQSRLYVSDCKNNEITKWNIDFGEFMHKINNEIPSQMLFTINSSFVNSPVFKEEIKNNKLIKIQNGKNCIFEINKQSLEIKRRIIGN